MAILALHGDLDNPLIDRRQSPRVLEVRRGLHVLLADMGHASLPELPLASGRRADLVSLSGSGEIWIVEIKSSVEDFRVDSKWPDYRRHCDRFWFAAYASVPTEIFPNDCGLIVGDAYGAEILREAPEHRLSAATRKAIMLRFARSAATRLTRAECFLPAR